MKRVITIILFLSGVLSLYAQDQDVNVKYYAPEYVIAGNEFEISSLVKFESDQLINFKNLLVIDKAFQLDSVKLFTKDSVVTLNYYLPEEAEFNKNKYIVDVFPQDSICKISPFLQLVYYGKTYQKAELNLHFQYQYQTQADSLDEESPFFINTNSQKIITYDKNSMPQKALLVKDGISVAVPEKYPKSNSVLSFWFNMSEFGNYFFELTTNGQIDSLLQFGIDETGLVKLNYSDDLIIWDDFFLSDNVWYKIQFAFNSTNQELELLINSKLIASVSNVNAEFIRDYNIGIFTASSPFMIDELEYEIDNGESRQSLKSHNFIQGESDSIKLLYSNSFDDLFISDEDEIQILVTGDQAENVEATLPIFSPAPELSMNYFNNYYELQWKPKNPKFAESFVIQKSVDGITYDNLFILDADPENPDKEYTYSDSKDITAEVVYYRVLQLNKDKSEVYSNLIKVGQGEIEEFSLEQNYPNPFNPVTNITLEVFVSGEYYISVYDLVGKRLATIHKGNLSVGKHTFSFDATDLPSGIYFYEVVSPSSSQVMKMILAK